MITDKGVEDLKDTLNYYIKEFDAMQDMASTGEYFTLKAKIESYQEVLGLIEVFETRS